MRLVSSGRVGAATSTIIYIRRTTTKKQRARIAAAKANAPKRCPNDDSVLERYRIAPDPQWYAACPRKCGYDIAVRAP